MLKSAALENECTQIIFGASIRSRKTLFCRLSPLVSWARILTWALWATGLLAVQSLTLPS